MSGFASPLTAQPEDPSGHLHQAACVTQAEAKPRGTCAHWPVPAGAQPPLGPPTWSNTPGRVSAPAQALGAEISVSAAARRPASVRAVAAGRDLVPGESGQLRVPLGAHWTKPASASGVRGPNPAHCLLMEWSFIGTQCPGVCILSMAAGRGRRSRDGVATNSGLCARARPRWHQALCWFPPAPAPSWPQGSRHSHPAHVGARPWCTGSRHTPLRWCGDSRDQATFTLPPSSGPRLSCLHHLLPSPVLLATFPHPMLFTRGQKGKRGLGLVFPWRSAVAGLRPAAGPAASPHWSLLITGRICNLSSVHWK